MGSEDARQGAARLLGSCGLGRAPGRSGFVLVPVLKPLPGGTNNGVFRVEGCRIPCVLKVYSRDPPGGRDRLGSEFSFSRFAWDRGLRCLPRPLASDAARGLALYELVSGRQPRSGEVTPAMVDEALSFVVALNRHRSHPEAAGLPVASDAGLSLGACLGSLERRLERLEEAGREARSFIRAEFLPAAQQALEEARAAAMEEGLPLEEELPARERCLSPSDFGFHNALLSTAGRAEGRVVFLDFEYAGWDDPAKMIADLFTQPEVEVPGRHLPRFAARVAELFPPGEALLRRLELLLPICALKWCCILLKPARPARGGARAAGDKQRGQLAKARRALLRLRGLTLGIRRRRPWPVSTS